jgi:myosin heavy subunit
LDGWESYYTALPGTFTENAIAYDHTRPFSGHLTKERDRVEHEKAELQARIATVTEQQSNDAGVHEPAGETGAELERERVELGEKVDDFHVVSSAIRNQLDTMHKVVLSADSAGLAELASAIQESTCVLKESQEEMDQLVDSELAQAGWKCARAKVISNGGKKLREELKAYTIMTEWDKDITQLRSEKDALDLKHAELASVLTGLQTLMTAGKASLEFHADVAELEAAGEEEVTTTSIKLAGFRL